MQNYAKRLHSSVPPQEASTHSLELAPRLLGLATHYGCRYTSKGGKLYGWVR
jgi:hypothetical protein